MTKSIIAIVILAVINFIIFQIVGIEGLLAVGLATISVSLGNIESKLK